MPFNLTVRQIGPDDLFLHDYRFLRIQLWPECQEECEREIAEILADPDRWAVFVASPDNRAAVAFIEVHLREYAEGARCSPVAFLEGWFVVAEQRGRGLGRALLKAAEGWALARGCNELASDTEVHNELSIKVHGRLGFQEVERHVCFLKRLE